MESHITSVRININKFLLFYCVVIAVVYWAIFSPGILAVDSVHQYRQAVTGEYTDWHPVIMALLLAVILKTGGDLSLLIFLQILLGFVGIFRLTVLVNQLCRMPKLTAHLTSGFILLFFSLPITPFVIYLSTFWKDTWLLILMIWFVVLLLDVSAERHPAATRRLVIKTLALMAVASLILLVRHNTIVMFPVMMFAVWWIYRSKDLKWYAIPVVILAPLLIYFSFNTFQYSILKTARTHIEHIVYEIDLVSMIAYNPSLLDVLPYTAAHLKGDLRRDFEIGDSAYADLYLNELIDQSSYLAADNHDLLVDEYKYAVLHFPLTWLSVKAIMFLSLIDPSRERYAFHDHMQKNEFGISFNSFFSSERQFIFAIGKRVMAHPVARWFSYTHLPWFLLDIVMMAGGILLHFRKPAPGRNYAVFISMLSIPLVYYFSFFLAVTAPDFRFMYPSTLIVQLIFLIILSHGVGNFLSAGVGRSERRIVQ